jgi:hypothetical protein
MKKNDKVVLETVLKRAYCAIRRAYCARKDKLVLITVLRK